MMQRPAVAPAKSLGKRAFVSVGLLLLACLQVPLLCQITNTPVAHEAAPLRYRIIVSKPSVCEKQNIDLDLELENASDHKVLIDPAGLLYQVTISGAGRGNSSVADRLKPPKPAEYVVLAPGDSYRKTLPYPLGETDLSSHEGIYTIRLSYGQFAAPSSKLPNLYRGSVESNEALFEIKVCSDDNRRVADPSNADAFGFLGCRIPLRFYFLQRVRICRRQPLGGEIKCWVLKPGHDGSPWKSSKIVP
jgi:hypothetical protein